MIECEEICFYVCLSVVFWLFDLVLVTLYLALFL